MSCYRPLIGYFAKTKNPSGKRSLQFNRTGSFSGSPVKVPCGSCVGCKLERTRVWGIRCLHENRMHKESCFVTLTYSNEFLPANGSLDPRCLQLFHKRLHNRLLDSRGVGIRYFGCGEYGDLNQRPHYHSLLFGYRPHDLVLYSENRRGEAIYSSRFLDEVWSFGNVRVGAVSFESAAYVARYSIKKATKQQREDGHYVVYDSDGVVHERVPEFAVMSRRPGIGSSYFDKYGSEIMAHDSVIVGGREVPSVRYYDLKIEALDSKRLDEIKKVRRSKSKWSERLVDRRIIKEQIASQNLRRKERKL